MGREEFRNAQARRDQSDLAKRIERTLGNVPINANVIDRFGRPLKVGCHVIFHNPMDLEFEILDIVPEMSARVQPGTFRLELRCVPLRLHTMSGLPTDLLIVTKYAEVLEEMVADEAFVRAAAGEPGEVQPVDPGTDQPDSAFVAGEDASSSAPPTAPCILSAGYCPVHGVSLPHMSDGSLITEVPAPLLPDEDPLT